MEQVIQAQAVAQTNRNTSKKLLACLQITLLSAFSALMLLPLVYAFFASFKTLPDLMANGAILLPREWVLSNYSTAWGKASFSTYFLNSFTVSASVVLADVLLASMFGYVLARKQLPGQKAIEAAFASTIFLGIGTITLYPQFLMAMKLGVMNLTGVVLVELGTIITIHVFLVKSYCLSISREMDDAAKVDGASFYRTFWSIMFPVLKPILATITILGFQQSWNNFQVPYVFTMNAPEARTIIIGLYALRSSDGASEWNIMIAGTMLALVPVVVLFLFMQQYFMRGFTEGSVKG